MTPLEREKYESYRRDVLAHPGMEFYIPTDLPDSGIEMSYAGADGEGLTAREVASLSEKAERVVGILERCGMTCQDGFLTVGFMDAGYYNEDSHVMRLKRGKYNMWLYLPRFGSAIEGQLEEQLSYGIAAYTMRNFNGEEEYVMRTLEEIACRVVSVFVLRETGFREKAEEVLQNGGTVFKCPEERNAWERSGDTPCDIRAIAAQFTGDDVVPFLRLRDYVIPDKDAELRSLNTEALLHNYPSSEAVKALCAVWDRIDSDTMDFADYMMGDPYPDD